VKLVVAVTGASGSIYAENFLRAAKSQGIETHLIVTDAGKTVVGHELGDSETLTGLADFTYEPNDLEAPLASGSIRVDGMVIVPATMKTVAALAHGYNANLVTRAADVHLKEGRPLIVVPRETPLHAVHLENMARLGRLGAVILPAMPGFYHNPESIDDLASFISGKILDQLGVPNKLYRRWGGP